jgi:two-component system sensor histidine kinase VicK
VDELQIQLSQQSILLSVVRQLADQPDAVEQALTVVLDGAEQIAAARGARLVLVKPVDNWAVYGHGVLTDIVTEADHAVLLAVEGHEAGELISVPAGEVCPAGSLPDLVQAIAAAPLQVGGQFCGALWLAFDEMPVWTESEDTLLAILVTQAALTVDRARTLSSTRRQREWMAAIINSAVDPAIVLGDSLEILLLNVAAQDALHIDAGTAQGRTLADFAETAKLAALLQADRETQPLHTAEFEGANGKTYSPSLAEVTIWDEMGRVLWLRDITHFKRVNANLSDFLSTVSHDMRSPLTFMKGYCDMMGLVGPLNERQTSFVEKIGSGVMQMSDMVEKILEAGRLDPETGSYELAREATDVNELAQKVVTSMAAAADKKGLSFSSTIEPDLPVMNLDKGMVGSAFSNLVENAVKYTPEGGAVDIMVGVVDGSLQFRVSDNGLGISKNDQKKLFRRNVRIRRKEWERVKGNGLGLFIVKNVAQRHGGDVWVDSEPGHGCTFTLMIPLEGYNKPSSAM